MHQSNHLDNQYQNTYSAYPETQQNLQGVANYQGVVVGLSGWNDPPKFSGKSDLILDNTANPEQLIMDTIKNILEILKTSNIQERMLQDTEKRMNMLFEKLQIKEVETSTLALVVHLSNSLNLKDYQKASGLVMELMQKGSAADSKWVVGLKRLVELVASIA